MQLLTSAIRETLLANGRAQDAVRGTSREIDFIPVVKLFNPSGIGTWLLTELDPENPDIAFGLCDLGFPELGAVSIAELESVRGLFGLGIDRDLHWTATKTLSAYAEEARRLGRVGV